jgi:copper homeostasis protein
MLLEIAVFNIDSAINAAKAGADRIELCENPNEGGTTPSYGTLKLTKENISVPVFPIIRPRGGDFLYSSTEFKAMQQDILLCKELGFEGVVLGLLRANATIDIERTAQLVSLAYPMEVTFHRAFDRASDPFAALEDIINCGCQRILTSGQVQNAFDNKELIKKLIEKAENRIIIMPGSGIRSSNIIPLANFTGAIELHSSARIWKNSPMIQTNESMKEILQNMSIDSEEIKKMKSLLSA